LRCRLCSTYLIGEGTATEIGAFCRRLIDAEHLGQELSSRASEFGGSARNRSFNATALAQCIAELARPRRTYFGEFSSSRT